MIKKHFFFVLICLCDEIPSSGGSTRICRTVKWLPNPKGVAEPKNSEILQPIKTVYFYRCEGPSTVSRHVLHVARYVRMRTRAMFFMFNVYVLCFTFLHVMLCYNYVML